MNKQPNTLTQQKLLWKGRQVLENLATIYEQLYLQPGEEAEALYKKIVLQGEHAPTKDLSHFHSTEEDSCILVKTPAGEIQVITLCDRRDFDMFFKIIVHKCKDIPIPPTIGASLLDGVINQGKIRAHKEEFLQRARKNPLLSWEEEEKLFFSNRRNYSDVIIILSKGPYSALTASEVGYAEEEWLSLSQTIRLYHECTHFVCRKFYPEKIDAIWDELIADAVGIYAALSRMDIPLAQRFLGITDGKYTGGRLENYLPSEVTDKAAYIHSLLGKIQAVMEAFQELCKEGDISPFDAALQMEEKKEELW